MKTKILIASSLGLLVTACGSEFQIATIDGCTTPRPVSSVAANPKNKVKLNLQAANLQANPPTVCSRPGDTIEVTIKQPVGNPTPPTVSVYIVPKKSANGWMLASNTLNPELIEITVPTDASTTDDNGNYEYLIITSDGRCVDPRIHLDPALNR